MLLPLATDAGFLIPRHSKNPSNYPPWRIEYPSMPEAPEILHRLFERVRVRLPGGHEYISESEYSILVLHTIYISIVWVYAGLIMAECLSTLDPLGCSRNKQRQKATLCGGSNKALKKEKKKETSAYRARLLSSASRSRRSQFPDPWV